MQYVPRYWQNQGEMKRDYTNSQIVDLIVDRIHKARDRQILFDRYVHGLTFEQLAEKHDLSVRQIKNIVYKGTDFLFR